MSVETLSTNDQFENTYSDVCDANCAWYDACPDAWDMRRHDARAFHDINVATMLALKLKTIRGVCFRFLSNIKF